MHAKIHFSTGVINSSKVCITVIFYLRFFLLGITFQPFCGGCGPKIIRFVANHPFIYVLKIGKRQIYFIGKTVTLPGVATQRSTRPFTRRQEYWATLEQYLSELNFYIINAIWIGHNCFRSKFITQTKNIKYRKHTLALLQIFLCPNDYRCCRQFFSYPSFFF